LLLLLLIISLSLYIVTVYYYFSKYSFRPYKVSIVLTSLAIASREKRGLLSRPLIHPPLRAYKKQVRGPSCRYYENNNNIIYLCNTILRRRSYYRRRFDCSERHNNNIQYGYGQGNEAIHASDRWPSYAAPIWCDNNL